MQTNSKNDLEEEAITEPTTIPTKIDVESIMASTITSFDDEEPPLRLKVSQTPETLVQMMDDVESEEEEEEEEEVIGKGVSINYVDKEGGGMGSLGCIKAM